MRLRSYRSLLLVCSILLYGCEEDIAGRVAQRMPKIAVDSARHDVGDVGASSNQHKHVFVLKNEGDQDLIIESVENDCGCAVAKVSNRIVPPKGQVKLRVALDTTGIGFNAGSNGFIRRIVVISNDPTQRHLVLSLTGRRAINHFFYPPQIELGPVDVGHASESELVYIPRRIPKDQTTNPKPTVKTSSPWFKASVKLGSFEAPPFSDGVSVEDGRFDFAVDPSSYPRRGYRIDIRSTTHLPAGQHRHYLLITTGDPNDPEITVPINAIVTEPLKISPRRVFWGVVDPNKRSVILRHVELNGHGQSFEVFGAESNIAGIQLDWQQHEPDRWVLSISLQTGMLDEGAFEQLITVRTDYPDMEEFTIGTYGRCFVTAP